MNLSRFFVDQKNIQDQKFVIDDKKDIKKIVQVLRLKPKDKILLLDQSKNQYEVEIDLITNKRISGKILEKEKNISSVKYDITLAQSLTRSSKIADIIKMNTQVGVNAFLLFESEYSLFRLDKFKSKKKERFETIAKEAAQQSERDIVPVIYTPIHFDDLFAENFDIKILLHSRDFPDTKDISYVKKLLQESSKKTVLIAVGPEGGFSPKEVTEAHRKGFIITYINLPILRTETAGVVASAILNY